MSGLHDICLIREGTTGVIAQTLLLLAEVVSPLIVGTPLPSTETTLPVSAKFVVLEHHATPLISNDPPRRRADVRKPMPSSHSNIAAEARRAYFHNRIVAAELRHRLPIGMLDAVIWTESAYDPSAISLKGAAGLSQLMPATAAMLGVRNPFDALMSIDGGGRYLRLMIDRFGSVPLALAAYNAGPARVHRARGIPRFPETQYYVLRVLRRWRTVS